MPSTPVEFASDLRYEDLPASVVSFGKRCLLDLLGVAAAGTSTELSRLIRAHAARHFAGNSGTSSLFFDGRQVSPLGAALANGMTIDAFDAHDGHPLTKGHIGCGVLPALLACCESENKLESREFLTCLVAGYEIGARAGIALHATADDYHTSGAWSAVACAAVSGRILGLTSAQMREALGIAEYHGPRSQMMRCIDYPTMVKDGSGWGSMAGVSAAYLAADGFTGAPAITLEADDVRETWSDLGVRWRIEEQYFKPYPVCRWAQPAVEAALQLVRKHEIEAGAIERIDVTTFHEAVRLATRTPANTEEAQYSLPFPVAAAIVRGTIGAAEIASGGLNDPAILHLSNAMHLSEQDDYNDRFPVERWAHVTITMRDGRSWTSPPTVAHGNAENPLSDSEIKEKFHSLCQPLVGAERSTAIQQAVRDLPSDDALPALLHTLTPAPEQGDAPVD